MERAEGSKAVDGEEPGEGAPAEGKPLLEHGTPASGTGTSRILPEIGGGSASSSRPPSRQPSQRSQRSARRLRSGHEEEKKRSLSMIVHPGSVRRPGGTMTSQHHSDCGSGDHDIMTLALPSTPVAAVSPIQFPYHLVVFVYFRKIKHLEAFTFTFDGVELSIE